MATIHISKTEAARDFEGLLARLNSADEIAIEDGASVIAFLRPAPVRLTFSERLALLDKNSPGVVDEDFARDVQAGIDSHREPLDSSAWD